MDRTGSLINSIKSLNKKSNYPICPYCAAAMHIVIKSFGVCFKTPKIPPKGAKDLKLFHIIPITYLKKYVLCPKCEAKYDYDNNTLTYFQESLLNIPPSSFLLNDFVQKELPKYPKNTTCQLLWRRSWRKKRLVKKPFLNRIRKIYNSINTFFHF
jgi:hypothetical protein